MELWSRLPERLLGTGYCWHVWDRNLCGELNLPRIQFSWPICLLLLHNGGVTAESQKMGRAIAPHPCFLHQCKVCLCRHKSLATCAIIITVNAQIAIIAQNVNKPSPPALSLIGPPYQTILLHHCLGLGLRPRTQFVYCHKSLASVL